MLRHIAVAERLIWAETLEGHPSRYTTHGKELADGYENIIAFMERRHAESMEIFAKLRDRDLQRKCRTPDGASITKWKWLRLMTELKSIIADRFIFISESSVYPLRRCTV